MSRTKKTNLELCLRAFVATLATAMFGPLAHAVAVGDKLAPLKVMVPATGASTDLDTTGKVTIVNFWATWCEACKVEIKEMQEKFGGITSNPKVQIAFVALDKDPAKAKEWFSTNVAAGPWQGYLFGDPSFKIADELGVDAFPMTLIIKPDGTVQHIQRGFAAEIPSTDQIVAKATELLKN